MEEETDNQTNNKPWLWKKGQSGNLAGRPKGKSMKEYSRDFLASMTDEERQEFLIGIPKVDIWKLAEGNPETKTDITSKGESINVIIPQAVAETFKINESNQETRGSDKE